MFTPRTTALKGLPNVDIITTLYFQNLIQSSLEKFQSYHTKKDNIPQQFGPMIMMVSGWLNVFVAHTESGFPIYIPKENLVQIVRTTEYINGHLLHFNLVLWHDHDHVCTCHSTTVKLPPFALEFPLDTYGDDILRFDTQNHVSYCAEFKQVILQFSDCHV